MYCMYLEPAVGLLTSRRPMLSQMSCTLQPIGGGHVSQQRLLYSVDYLMVFVVMMQWCLGVGRKLNLLYFLFSPCGEQQYSELLLALALNNNSMKYLKAFLNFLVVNISFAIESMSFTFPFFFFKKPHHFGQHLISKTILRNNVNNNNRLDVKKTRSLTCIPFKNKQCINKRQIQIVRNCSY